MSAIASVPLTADERAETIAALRALQLSLAAPGDYGYESRLGQLITLANDIRRDLEAASIADRQLQVCA